MVRVYVILITLSFSSALSQQIKLSARTDSASRRIGDWIDVRVDGNLPPEIETIIPAVKDSLGQFEVLKVERTGNDPRWIIRLMTLDSGKVFVPPIEFNYRVRGDTTSRKAYSNSLILTIASIVVDPQGEIKDIKPPLNAPWKFEDFLPYIIALVVLSGVAGLYYYYRKRRKQKEEMLVPFKPKVPPHQQALFELRVLEEKKLWQQGRVKEYYSEATEIIRKFVEGRWGIVALELTSDEILQQMKNVPDAKAVWKEMQSFFTTADLVKFAKYEPSPAEHENELRWAYEIVRAMVPKEPSMLENRTEEVVDAR